MARNTMALPLMYMHDVKAVSKMPLVLPENALVQERDDKQGWKGWESLSKNAKDGEDSMLTLKYTSMCYGNREDMHLHTVNYKETMCEDSTHGHGSPWQQSSALGADKQWIRALLLEKWQYESHDVPAASFFGSHSFCTCMDHMHLMHIDPATLTARRAEFLTKMQMFIGNNTHPDLVSYFNSEYFQLNSRGSAMYGDVGSVTTNNAALTVRLGQVFANMRSSNMFLDFRDHKTYSSKNATDFCTVHSIPEHTVVFKGVMDSWRYILVGQFLLLVSCIYSFQIHYHKITAPLGRVHPSPPDGVSSDHHPTSDGASKHMQPNDDEHGDSESSSFAAMAAHSDFTARFIWAAIRIVASVVMSLIVLVQSLNELEWQTSPYSVDNNANEAGLTSEFSKVARLDSYYFIFAFIMVLVVVVLEMVYLRTEWNKPETLDKTQQMSVLMTTRVLFTLMHDIYIITALILLSVGVMLQSNTQDYRTVVFVSFVIGVAALVQHISNMMNIVFDVTTGQLLRDKKLYVDALQNMRKNFEKRKSMLLRICYIRSGITTYVVTSAVLFLTNVSVSKISLGDGTLKVMFSVAFAIAAVVILCGFDMFYELFYIRPPPSTDPKQDKKSSRFTSDKRYMHLIFVYVYISFVNFMLLGLKS